MPRKDINHNNTIIYKIVCNNLNIKDIYVGHTTQFTKRKNNHKERCNNPNSKKYNLKIYKIIRENEGWDNWSMIEIEKYPCNDKNEACSRERYWYEQLNSTMNTLKPMITKEELKIAKKAYKQTNKYKVVAKIYDKKYRTEHIEERKEYDKIKSQEVVNCPCGICYKGLNHKNRHENSKKHIDNMAKLE